MCTFAPGQPHHDAITVFDHPKVKDCLIDEFKKKKELPNTWKKIKT